MNPTANAGTAPARPSSAPRTPTSNESLLPSAPVVLEAEQRRYLYCLLRATADYDSAIFDLLVGHGRGYSYQELRQTLSGEPYALTTKAALHLEPADAQLTAEDIRQDVPELLVRTGLPLGLRRDPADGVWRLQVLHEDAVEPEVDRILSYGGGNRAAAQGMQGVLDSGESCEPPRRGTKAAAMLSFLAEQSAPVKAASAHSADATIERALGFTVEESRGAVSWLRRAGHLIAATAAGYELVAVEEVRASSAARAKVERTIRSLLHREETQLRRVADLRENARVWYGGVLVFDSFIDRTRAWEARRHEKEQAKRERTQAARAARTAELAALRREVRERRDALNGSRTSQEVAFIAHLNATGEGLDVAIARLREEEAAGTLDLTVAANAYVARARDLREYGFFVSHGHLPMSWKRAEHWLPDRLFRKVDAPETKRQKRRERRTGNRTRRARRWGEPQPPRVARREPSRLTELPLPF